MDIAMTDVWRIIKRRLLLIVTLIVVSLAATSWLSFYVLQPEYEATAKLLVQSQSQNNQMAYTELDTNQRLMTTYSEIIKSNRIAEDVINRLNLSTTPKELLKNVKVQATEDSLVTSLTVKNHDPAMAVALANGFAQSFYDNLSAIMKVDNVSIFDEAKLPANPVPISPKPYLNLSVAFVLASVVGVCIAVLMEFLDQTVKTEEHIEELLGLPVLGVVVHFKDTKRSIKKMNPRKAEEEGGTPHENESTTPAILP